MILRRFITGALLPVAAAITLAFLVQGAVAKPYEVPTGSMEPTIRAGDRIIANRVVYHLRDIRRGDIIVFTPTAAARQSCGDTSTDVPFVKRVIGLPGDTIQIPVGRREVSVNGELFDVPAAHPNPAQPPTVFTVPAAKLFVMGDNRDDSCDSHTWSDPYVPVGNVIGQAEIAYWPLRDATFLK